MAILAEPESTLDIIVTGAGLSGINAAYRLQQELPEHSFAILEARDCIGGTWAFWKYPGIRSDSAMALFGFPWHPWPHSTNIAEAHVIKKYMEDAAAAHGIDKKIRFGHCITSASWSSEECRWTVLVDAQREDGTIENKTFKCSWLINANGYYDYEKPMPAVIPGIDSFGGEVVHPQFWTDKVDFAGKKVVVIGSGATAVTLLPALAKTAESVTMLQRSPSYVLSLGSQDNMMSLFSRFLPLRWAALITWWQRMIIETITVYAMLTFPNFSKRVVRSMMRPELPKDLDADKHFNPSYGPFEQRLCFCPDGDFFKALHRPNTHVVTDTIETVTETGILLKSGQKLDADMIITATGLYLALLSGISVIVDGLRINDTLGQRYIWHGTMLEGVPNSGLITGYTAGTWTPGADARTRQLIKVIKHMGKTGATSATPFVEKAERDRFSSMSALSNSSTYITSARERMPITAESGPWRHGRNWVSDAWHLVFGSVTDGMRYTFSVKRKDV
ncbi:hypothetical protein B0T22DRAFT_40652 [Podospora appendiculata]|uniref:Monooxygenase n=1 Tax=Podospora appendiculata TaxID=314037 RepID=A0AAE0XHB8_9PEZI|nr:hypothetical protein B0T22DRAFT_40652 [Podospora appendiculata]